MKHLITIAVILAVLGISIPPALAGDNPTKVPPPVIPIKGIEGTDR